MTKNKDIIQPWPEWVSCDDVILWNTTRLSRNISGYRFPIASNAEQNQKIYKMLSDTVREVFFGGDFIELAETDFEYRKLLRDRFLIDTYMVSNPFSSGVIVSQLQDYGIDINSTSHLVFFSIEGGNISRDKIDAEILQAEEIGQDFPYAFLDDFGYLTPLLEECGTGLKISLYLRLPGFLLLGKFSELRDFAEENDLDILPHSFGEDNLFGTGIFCLNNMHTFGMNIESLIEQMEKAKNEIVEMEREYRAIVFEESRDSLEEKIMQTVGMLKYSKRISNNYFGKMLFSIMLGIELGILPISMDEVIQAAFSLSSNYIDVNYPNKDSDLIKQIRAKTLQNLLQNI
ncbi:MAG: hypothetical protein ACLFSQ_11690 [Candidatus Zixiibacteriota bacterium]